MLDVCLHNSHALLHCAHPSCLHGCSCLLQSSLSPACSCMKILVFSILGAHYCRWWCLSHSCISNAMQLDQLCVRGSNGFFLYAANALTLVWVASDALMCNSSCTFFFTAGDFTFLLPSADFASSASSERCILRVHRPCPREPP